MEQFRYYKRRGIVRNSGRLLAEAIGAYVFVLALNIGHGLGVVILFALLLAGIHVGVTRWRARRGESPMRLARMVERTSFPGDSIDEWIASHIDKHDLSPEQAQDFVRAFDDGYRAAQRDLYEERSARAKRAARR